MPVIDRAASQARFNFSGISGRNHAIVRSDGKTFRIEAAEKPVIFPAAVGSPDKMKMASIGFWYTHARNGRSPECVVVMIRQPVGRPIDALRQVEIIADKLAEQLSRGCNLSAVYEFDGFKMVLKAC